MRGLVLGSLLWLICSPVEASVRDWPVVKQTVNVGICLLASTGKLGGAAVRHLYGFGAEVLLITKDCLLYSLDAVTPGNAGVAQED